MDGGVIIALFPPGARGTILQQVLAGEMVLERYMLYGLDRLITDNFRVKVHLDFKAKFRFPSFLIQLYGICAKKLIGAHGELTWFFPYFLDLMSNGVVFSFSEKCIYPLLFFRFMGFFRNKKIILISIGLVEKLQILGARGDASAQRRLLRQVSTISHIITFSWSEKSILTDEYRLGNVVFVPLGVDTELFCSRTLPHSKKYNIVSVGADKNRDFELLVQLAIRLKEQHFLLITNRHHAERLCADSLPTNVEVLIDVPMAVVRDALDASGIVFLPVRENQYSGATTCLLQAMSLSKAVITAKVGPISGGYGLVHGENVIYYTPGDVDDAERKVTELLSDPNQLHSLGEKARLHVKRNLGLEKMIDAITTVVIHEYEGRKWRDVCKDIR